MARKPKGKTVATLTEQVPTLIRQARGELTQLEAAAKLGINPQTWSRWERGEHVPDLQTLERIAKVFKVPMELRACAGSSR